MCVNLCYNVVVKKALLVLLSLSSLLLLCCNRVTEIELTVVSKIPRGAYAGEVLPPELGNIGWYDIGLSRNGKEPIEYIWRAGKSHSNYFISCTEIGDRGTVGLKK